LDHLLRQWLRAPEIRPVLEVFDERLNGISVPGLVPTVPLDVE
jgi:hypothetical protein